ncbi:hypothetical protein H4W80_007651 [Nonomuraea angiospora]|uniref:Uncharacterized protein n=1 Tax=Nonomuraea angiospora TaxID=46172 RepID=A0ABR9MA12_9ACTN|nr:hypothetical protein [Nonomuraea angiospora]
MTTRPYALNLPPSIARPRPGRLSGNVAAPDTKLRPREATCRKDFGIA